MTNNFNQLVNEAASIMVTSHISPDPDAVSSVLLMGRTLIKNFPGKKILMLLEEEPMGDLGFLSGYDELKFGPVNRALADEKPELFIITDANNYSRVSRKGGEEIRSIIADSGGRIKTVIIDHHELDGLDQPDLLINNKRPASVEEVYVLLFEEIGLEKPGNFAETALLGIISDTQRHRFDHPGYRETYRIVADLIDAGASIEKLESRLEHHTKNELDVISHLAQNMTSSGKGYSYSYVSDEYIKKWLSENKPADDIKNAVELFTNKFIRSFEGNKWGFVVYPELIAGDGCWGVSLRSVSGARDVSAIARELGGGGHKPAAGAKVQADSVMQVIEKVQTVIDRMS